MGIRTEEFTVADALSFLPSDINPTVLAVLETCDFTTLSGGQDIVQFAISNCGLSAVIAAEYVGKYFFPTDTNTPVVNSYVSGEGRAGFYLDYSYDERWWGSLNIYGLGRADFKTVVSSDTLAGKEEIGDINLDNNTLNLTTDLKFGYKSLDLVSLTQIWCLQMWD